MQQDVTKWGTCHVIAAGNLTCYHITGETQVFVLEALARRYLQDESGKDVREHKGSTTADDSGLLAAPWREHNPHTNLMLACVLGLVQQVWPSNGMTTSSQSGWGGPSQPTCVPQQSSREASVGQQSRRGDSMARRPTRTIAQVAANCGAMG